MALSLPRDLSKTEIAAIALAVIALLLRLLWLGRTDHTGDEIFGVKFAYKISLFLAHYWWAALLLVAVLAAIVYFVGWKKNWKLAGLIAAALVCAQLFTDIPLTLHISNGPGIYLANALTTLATGLPPHLAGQVTVTLFMLAMAAAGYFLAKSYLGRPWNWIALALVLASPLGGFLGGTDFAYGMSDSLMYIALALTLIALKEHKPHLLSLGGVAMAFSIATRYPPLLMLAFFAIIAYLKRDTLMQKDFRPAVLAFVLLAGGTAVAYGIEAGNTYHLWNTLWKSQPGFADKPHFSLLLSDVEHGAVGPDGEIADHIYVLFLNFFYTPVIWPYLALALFALYRQRRKLLALFLLITPAFLFVFTQSAYRRPNYVNTIDFALLFGIAVGLAYYKRAGKYAAIALTVILLAQGAFLLSEHTFTGFSRTIESIPDGARVYASFYDGALYYSGNYKADTDLGNAFFNRFLSGVPAQGSERIEVVFGEEHFSDSNADFAVFEHEYVNRYQPDQNGFTLCRSEIFHERDVRPVISVYASSPEKCARLGN